jgi:hypothetical protein
MMVLKSRERYAALVYAKVDPDQQLLSHLWRAQ